MTGCGLSLKTAVYPAWNWFCLFYALLLISFGISIPLISGWDIARNSEALTEYISFLVVIYSVSISFFIVYNYKVRNYGKLLSWIVKKRRDFVTFSKRCYQHRSYSIYDKNHSVFDSETEDRKDKESRDKMGKHGLKLAVKVSSIVLIIMLIVQLSYYVQARRKLDKDCELDEKGAMILLMFFYVLLQAHFLLTASKENFDTASLFIQFGCAHLTGTAISTGIFLTLHDDVLKLYPLYKKVRDAATDFEATNTVDDHYNSEETQDAEILVRKIRSVPAVKVNVSQPCSLSSYIVSTESQLKPFTFQLSMFYIYCCSIILVLLFLHMRKIQTNRDANAQSVSLFKTASRKGATFSTSAGLSLIILAIIASLLSLNDNIYAIFFLIFLHTQATCVGLVALCKIAYVPCSWKRHGSKNHVIFLCFYFAVMVSVTLKIISNKVTEEPHEQHETVIEMAETSLDLIQLFLQGLLILIGLLVDIVPGVLHRHILPCEILIHLAATNMSDLITNIFRKHTYDYYNFIKQEGHNNEGLGTSADGHQGHVPSESDVLAMQIPSTIMGSVLLPCISFHRFYSIVCLIKLHKAWSPDEHYKPVKGVSIEESHF